MKGTIVIMNDKIIKIKDLIWREKEWVNVDVEEKEEKIEVWSYDFETSPKDQEKEL